jgi:hypothetical protein
MTDAHEIYNLDDDEPSAFETKPRKEWLVQDYADALDEYKISMIEIPEWAQTGEVLRVEVARDRSLYDRIPEHRLTTDIQLAAIRAFPSLFLMEKYFNPTLCANNYYTLACAAVAADAVNIHAVKIQYIDRRLVSEAIATQPTVVYHLEQKSKEMCKELIDQAFVEDAVIDNLSCLFLPKTYKGNNYLAEFPLSDDVLIKAVKEQPKKAGLLADLGREGLLTEMIRSGYWPEYWHDIARPNDLEAGIKAFIENKQSNLQRTYYKAYINQWPSSEVIPLMLQWPRKNYLPDLFPKEELFDVFKDDLQTMGKWFSQDLGL